MNPPSHLFYKRQNLAYALLMLVPALVYLKGLTYPFSPMDEQWLIVGDKSFLENWSYLFKAFNDAIQGIYYRPMLMASFTLDYHLGGLNPTQYHISNLIFHIIATVLLFRLLLALKTDRFTALLLALMFSLHPLLAHAVEWVPGRNDSLLCIFSLAALIQLIRYCNEKKIIHGLLHLLFFVLALFTKENAVMLPLVFAVLFLIYNKPDKLFFLWLLLWAGCVAGWVCIRYSVIQYFPSGSKYFFSDAKEFLHGMLVFTGKALFPAKQSVSPTPANSSIIPGLLALIVLVILFFKPGLSNKKTALAGLLLFVLMLVMPVWYGVLSPLGEQYEHRSYTALCGLFIFAGQLNVQRQRIFHYLLLLIAVVFAVKTEYRIPVYKSDLSYLEEGIAGCPENYIFQSTLATVLYKKHDLYAALTAYDAAIRLQPSRTQLYYNRGNVYLALNKGKEAIDDYDSALKFSNTESRVWILLTHCDACNRFGDIENAMRDIGELKQCCRNQLPAALEKQITGKWYNLKFKEVNAALQQHPNDAALYITRAQLYFNRRMGPEALSDLKKACELEPGNAQYKADYNKLKSTYKP